jgi:hypothetical protein
LQQRQAPLTRHPRFFLETSALRYVAHDRDDQEVAVAGQRAQTHFDGKLAAILALPVEVQVGSHGPRMGSGPVARSVLLMDGMDTGRQERLDRTPNEHRPVVAKEHLRLMVHEENMARRVGSDDAIWSQLEERLGE